MAGNVKVNCRVQLNEARISQLDKAARKSLEQTADATLTEITQAGVMPFMTGSMQNAQTSVKMTAENAASIVTAAPQARRLYYHPEYRFNKHHNAAAGGKWFAKWLDGVFITKAFKSLYKRNAGV